MSGTPRDLEAIKAQTRAANAARAALVKARAAGDVGLAGSLMVRWLVLSKGLDGADVEAMDGGRGYAEFQEAVRVGL